MVKGLVGYDMAAGMKIHLMPQEWFHIKRTNGSDWDGNRGMLHVFGNGPDQPGISSANLDGPFNSLPYMDPE